MTDEKRSEDVRAEADKAKTASGSSPPPGDGTAPVPGETKPAKELTKEEQMALYEEQLKEDDWGHQPC